MPTGAFVVEVNLDISTCSREEAERLSRPTGKAAPPGCSQQTRAWICRLSHTVNFPRLLSHATQMEAIPLAFPRTEVNGPKIHLLLLDLTCPGGAPVTGLASGTPANVKEASAHEFVLTLSTILTCDVPLPLSCQANNNELDFSQWDAFRVSPCFFRRVVSLRLCFQAHLYLVRQTNGGNPTSRITLRREAK